MLRFIRRYKFLEFNFKDLGMNGRVDGVKKGLNIMLYFFIYSVKVDLGFC